MAKKNFALWIPPEQKDKFNQKCQRKYESMSARLRYLINKDLQDEKGEI
jgi:hypothetical protein